MALDSRVPLISAIYSQLVASAAMQALIGNPARVYNIGGVPKSLWPGPDNDFPAYVTVGKAEGDIGQIETKTEDGMDGEVEVETWSSQRSTLEALQIQAVIVDEVKLANLTLASGHNLVLIYPDFSTTFLDQTWDAPVIHGVNRFRYQTERGP